uniref:Uncharacterized protein n=1 Tax=Piliocolobus tephrosceles TaxID=591936 RepID=A0A8C9GGR0_9PRIM
IGSQPSMLPWDEQLEEIKKEISFSHRFQNLSLTHWGTKSSMPSFQRERTG